MNSTLQQRTKTVVAAIAIAGLAVVGMDAYTYAATGDSLLLGKSNKANQTTRITSTGNGPALSLHAKGKRSALAVDSKAKIVRLNADRVDGKHAASLQNNVRVYTKVAGSSNDDGSVLLRIPDLPRGRYQFAYEVFMSGASGTPSNPAYGYCDLFTSAGIGTHSGLSTAISVSGVALAMNGSGVVNRPASGWLALNCGARRTGTANPTWDIDPVFPIRVTLTKIDKTIGGMLPTARTSPDAHLTTR